MSRGATLAREGFRRKGYASDDVHWLTPRKFRRLARRSSQRLWRRDWNDER